ncbi:MAG: hypothetical protein GY842_11070 [bacterium]|nr:hypothetical protein [bacterium]
MAHRLVFIMLMCPMSLGATSAGRELGYVDRSEGLHTIGMSRGNTELELGDVDGDGHVDIVCVGDHGSPLVNTEQHGIMVWFGDGAGGWSLAQYGHVGYGGVALGDVNGDGRMDVGYGVHHNYSETDLGDQILEVALGDGTGRSWTPWDDGLATNGETWGMFGTDFADVDNDGDLDLGSTAFGSKSGVHVYLNNGDGSWTQSFGILGGRSNMKFEFGEVNGDGHADFAATYSDCTVYLGDGLGGFEPADGNLPTSPYAFKSVSLGDLNDDGRAELVAVGLRGELEVWSWTRPGVWENLSDGQPAGRKYARARIADMDLDGRGDVVTLSEGHPGRVTILSRMGNGAWREISAFDTPNCREAAVLHVGVDGDHNGYPDIAVITEEPKPQERYGRNRLRFYAESSVPTSTRIHPRYPRGGEALAAGSVRFITWHTASPDPGPHRVAIELSTRGAEGPWTMIADSVPDSGLYQWHMPADLPTSARCLLRLTVAGVSAVTPDTFTIVGRPAAGDIDGDGDVDVTDFAHFVSCADGLGHPSASVCIRQFDANGDARVDAADITAFQAAFGAIQDAKQQRPVRAHPDPVDIRPTR